MITLHLTRADNLRDAYLKLPASAAEIGKVLTTLDAAGTDVSAIKITEVLSNVYNLDDYIKNADIEQPGVLDKLQVLAEKLQTMDRDSCLKFEGVLNANSANGIDDVLRLTEILDSYAMLTDAHNGNSLGRYLVEHDVGGFPERIRPYLDYRVIGAEFDANCGGAFCRGGYVVRKDALPKQLAELSQTQNEKSLMMLRLHTQGNRPSARVSTNLFLPATETSMDQAKQELGIDEFAEAEIVVVDYKLPYLAQLIPQECISVEAANELALAIEEMHQTDSELLKFLSVLDLEQPDSFTAACHLAQILDDYERISVDASEYGRSVLERIGADDELLNTIDGFTDFDALGKFYMQEDGVVQTEFGLVRRVSEPFQQEQSSEMTMQQQF